MPKEEEKEQPRDDLAESNNFALQVSIDSEQERCMDNEDHENSLEESLEYGPDFMNLPNVNSIPNISQERLS